MVEVTDTLLKAARKLSRSPVSSLARAGGGGNSRLYRIETAAGPLALKAYPALVEDSRDRLGVEAKALEFMRASGIDCVPRVHATDAERGLMLMDWLDGELVASCPTADDIDRVVRFLSRLHDLRGVVGSAAFPLASEACLSGAAIIHQIEARVARLGDAARDDRDLRDFLETCFEPLLERAGRRARAGYRSTSLDFEAPLARGQQDLIPADFGFHNVLRARGGRLYFIDFEYFGWDDPVKLAADFLLHPAGGVPNELHRYLRARLVDIYGGERSFEVRLGLLYPLYGLRWILILLNEYLPHRWRIRACAGGENDWDRAKRRQLSKAKGLAKDVASHLERQ